MRNKWGATVTFATFNINPICKFGNTRGHAVVQLVGGTGLQAEMSRVGFPTVSLELFIDIILPAAL